MASQKPLILNAGTTQRIPDADTLVVGVGIDAAAPGVLTIGGTTATSITLGSATIPVNIPGGVTTVGGTTFTTDATFDGNVTFGAGAADTVTFAALTTVTSDINFGGAPGTYKITNLANGTNPNDAVNFSQLSAIVSGVSSFQTSLSGLTPSSATGGAITLAGTLGVTSGGTGTATAFTQGSVVFAGASGVYDQDNANLFFDNATNSLGIRTATPNEALTVSGVISVGEGSAPTATAAFGKLWANSAADARPYWTDDTGQSFNLTLDRFNTLTPAASVAIDTSPALPVFNSLSLDQNTTFTTTNLGNGRSASVRVVCDGTTRSLTFPGGWTWLGSGVPPTSLAANDVGYLSITAYGATDADVVAAWSYENQPVPVTGTGVDNQISIWSGTNTQDGSANLTFDGTTLGVTGAITQSGGAVSLTGNAASSLTTSSGNLTLTGGAALLLTAAAGNEVVVNDGSADVDFRVEGDTNTHAIFVQGSDSHVGIGTSNVSAHLFNVGAGVAANFSVASGGAIHTYGGAAPTDGQILIGDTVQGRFEAASLTAGSGVTITPGAGSITISATGTDSTLVTLTTAQAANTAVTVGGAAAIATAASTSRVAGIVTATNTVKVLGICTCDVEGALSIAAGDVVYLSASEAGAVTNVAPSSSGQVVAELGIATAASSGGTVAALWQPKAIIVL
jgi:hypothetical protein